MVSAGVALRMAGLGSLKSTTSGSIQSTWYPLSSTRSTAFDLSLVTAAKQGVPYADSAEVLQGRSAEEGSR